MSSNSIDPEMLSFFLEEGYELLSLWEKACIELEKDASAENLNSLFRIVHNYKGSAHSISLLTLGDFVHKVEDLIGYLKKNLTSCNPDDIGFFLKAQSILHSWMGHLSKDSSYCPDLSSELAYLKSKLPQESKKNPEPELDLTLDPRFAPEKRNNSLDAAPPAPAVTPSATPKAPTPAAPSTPVALPTPEAPQTIDPELLNYFLEEGTELLSLWERACIELERNPRPENINALFRVVHNFKGSSQSISLTTLGDYVHKIEDLLNALKKDFFLCTPDIIGFFLKCQTTLVNWLTILPKDNAYRPDLTSDLQFIRTHLPQTSSAKDAKDADLFSDPRFSTPLPKSSLDFEASGSVNLTGESSPRTSSTLPNGGGASPPGGGDGGAHAERSRGEETIRVSSTKLDSLIRIVGEMSVHQAVVELGRKNKTLDSKLSEQSIQITTKLMKSLQTHAINLRMLTVESLFQRLERTARDIARKLGKKIDVGIEGMDVEIDKVVLEKITDPLIHMVRNSVDHGIEPTVDERISRGKPKLGRITIKAAQEVGTIVITIQDDGRGLDAEKLRDKAIEKGLVPKDKELTQDEAHRLIFLPGFSTAEKVTDISGRGVGMDVVRSAMDLLGGDIYIASQFGYGTQFSITLPLSLSFIDGLIVLLDERKYILSMQELEEVIEINRSEIQTTSRLQKIINLRGSAVPVEALKNFLCRQSNHPSAPVASDDKATQTAVIASFQGNRAALLVDAVLGQQKVFVKALDSSVAKIPGFSGATILNDGEPALIIDVKKISLSLSKGTLKEARAA